MKKIHLLYITFALLLTGLTSCEDLLTEEPNSKYDPRPLLRFGRKSGNGCHGDIQFLGRISIITVGMKWLLLHRMIPTIPPVHNPTIRFTTLRTISSTPRIHGLKVCGN